MTTQFSKEQANRYFQELQARICEGLEQADGGGGFRTDGWERPGGGGGVSRVMENGEVFEKGGVNTSEVFGTLPETIARRINASPTGFYATGISLVLHPRNPWVPTIHANLRYFEMEDGSAWFGGGTDLTPYYCFTEDAVHFHTVLRNVCDASDPESYRKFKRWCDEYFYLKHRGEARGVGGVFFDYLKGDPDRHFRFVQGIGDAFLDSYLPIVRRRAGLAYGERERTWQLIRRGRYVEFNLVYDRGTTFGLETNGRVESILMSLPPLVSWIYDHTPEPGSKEEELLEILRHPREWIAA
ncbi:MAG: oxygen-dependent coproporphyrinogen oxidase [Ignavibacteria bacterium]|nr:oxygen-dependent coproporphyrinogen oxidase [Ignavibacteria bacterium]